MQQRRPHIVVFYGGERGNHDLSRASGYWVCEHIPRSLYDVTPVEVTPEGRWKLPVGSLPRSGPVDKTMNMLSAAVKALSPRQALERLVSRPVNAFLTLLRGKGGDDGSLHSIGRLIDVSVLGSPADVCQQTSNKELLSQKMGTFTHTPYTRFFRRGLPFESVGSEIQEEFMPPFFVKPAAEEGSWGIEMIENLDDLQSTLKVALSNHDILVQEYLPGQEVAVTLFKDSKDKLHALPATLVVPQKAAFYDHLSNRIPGRAVLHTPDRHNTVSEEAEAIARGVYEELGCEGIVTVDMIAGDHLMDVLEINTIPSFGGISPLVHQLRAAGYHPSQILDEYIRASI